MAITAINISQDNIVNGSFLCPVHSPLIFLADVTYTDQEPSILYVDVIDTSNDEVIETYKCIPFSDPLANLRQFAFVANDVIKGLMGLFDDFAQLNNSFQYADGATKLVKFKFYHSDDELIFDEVTIDLVHGAAQFGENPNFVDVFNNEDQIYYAPEGQFVYIYFYNDDVANALTIDSPIANLEFAQDYDDEIFTDYDDTPFEIDIAL